MPVATRDVVDLDTLGAHARRADHPRGCRGRGMEVAADAARRLAVEDALGRHRAETPDDQPDLLAAEARETLLLLERLVVTQRSAAHADRDSRRLAALHVDVRGDCVARLVDRDRA